MDTRSYVGKSMPALEWVMARQSVTTDKAIGITNDANVGAARITRSSCF